MAHFLGAQASFTIIDIADDTKHSRHFLSEAIKLVGDIFRQLFTIKNISKSKLAHVD